jgi:hypothetical protein
LSPPEKDKSNGNAIVELRLFLLTGFWIVKKLDSSPSKTETFPDFINRRFAIGGSPKGYDETVQLISIARDFSHLASACP